MAAAGAVAAAVAADAAAEAAVVADGPNSAMHPFPSIDSKATPMNINRTLVLLRGLALALLLAVPLAAAAAPQETFATPDAAVDALMAALKADSDAALIAIFGEEHKDLILTSDRAGTSATRARILAAMQTLRVLKEPGPTAGCW